jgi:hypothetical protein
MFGFITANQKELSAAERTRYAGSYCGLCRELGLKAGQLGRSCLSYDMTFLSMLLSSLYSLPETTGSSVCIPRPFIPHSWYTTESVPYVSDMNLIFAYYQALDHWQDDRNAIALRKSRVLGKYIPAIKEKWPRQYGAIHDGLKRLAEIEGSNELKTDIPANCFGNILGEVFVWREDAYSPALRVMGAALGRFIYLADACNDLKADIKKERYNPLIARTEQDFTPILTMIMGECTAAFDTLPVNADSAILRNVLYSGVWQKYRRSPKNRVKQGESERGS